MEPCSSGDGISWVAPPNPAVFVQEGPGEFLPGAVAQGPAGYLVGEGEAAGFSAEGTIWRSGDGVHWSTVATPALDDLKHPWTVLGLEDRYLAGAWSGGRQLWFESTDGTRWTPASMPDGLAYLEGDASRGLRAVDSDGAPWYSRDGHTWTKAILPSPLDGFYVSWARMPNGHLLAVGGFNIVGNPHQEAILVESADGVTWQTTSFVGSSPATTAVAGDTVFVTAGGGLNGRTQLWATADSGQSWTLVGENSSGGIDIQLASNQRVIVSTDTGWLQGEPLQPAP
jgi:hypothetical protein